jgi:methylated-DNA-protein-cysteine methyltransferase related protein
MEDLYRLVQTIPLGRVTSYGALGQALTNRVSGLVVGGWLSHCESGTEVPWWRVIGADGTFKTDRRSPLIGQDQRRRLEEEGIEIVGDQVPIDRYFWQP